MPDQKQGHRHPAVPQRSAVRTDSGENHAIGVLLQEVFNGVRVIGDGDTQITEIDHPFVTPALSSGFVSELQSVETLFALLLPLSKGLRKKT